MEADQEAMMNTMSEVIQCLVYERKLRGWSTAEVARRLTEAGFKISQSSVWSIESDSRRRITLAEAVAFADLYGIKIADWLESGDRTANEAQPGTDLAVILGVVIGAMFRSGQSAEDIRFQVENALNSYIVSR